LFFLAHCGGGRPTYPPSAQHPLLSQALPEIRHRDTLDGQAFDSARAAGKPAVVKFFADYCKPCKETLPAAERVHQANPDVLFIGIEEDEDPDVARAVVRRYGLTFPVIHDRANVLSGRFRVSTMPMTFVVDGSGVIRWVGREGQTEEDIRRAVAAAR
jgi:thiol-disulfide isomerase/thioredoxin